MVSRTDAVIMIAQRLSLLRRKFHGTSRFRGIEPYMQEDLSLNTKQHPIRTISLVFRSPRQGQSIKTNFFDIHCLMMLIQLCFILGSIASRKQSMMYSKLSSLNGSSVYLRTVKRFVANYLNVIN